MAVDVSAGRMAQVPLGQVATIRTVPGPMVMRTEDAMPTAWVYVDVAGRDIGGYGGHEDRKRFLLRLEGSL